MDTAVKRSLGPGNGMHFFFPSLVIGVIAVITMVMSVINRCVCERGRICAVRLCVLCVLGEIACVCV